MNYITTTQLRTKTSELVKVLQEGRSVDLIHRSKVVGEIKPAQPPLITITNLEELRKALRAAKPKKLIPRSQRDKIYRKHLMEKYGKDLS